MTTLFRKYTTIIIVLFLVTFSALGWLFPSARLILQIIFLFGIFAIVGFAVAEKHKNAYQQGKITRRIFIQNVFLEGIGILLAMILAGLVGQYIAGIVTQQISHVLTKLVIAILIGLIVG